MPSDLDHDHAVDWPAFFDGEDARAALGVDRYGVSGLWTPLADAASRAVDPISTTAFGALGKVASLLLRADDWHAPYGPAILIEDRRSAIPSDLTSEEVAVLRSLAAYIPHTLLKARVNDLLSIMVPGRERLDLSKQHLDALIENGVSSDSWMHEREMWERALLVARRYGAPMRGRARKLEQELRRVIRTSDSGFMALRAAETLAHHGLARDRARPIAVRLEKLGTKAADDPDRARAYLRSASEWFSRAGLLDEAHRVTQLEIQSLNDEAEVHARSSGAQGTMRASHLFELALQRVRALPRATREELGLSHLPALFARRIRELGATSLGSMTAFSSESIDLTAPAKQARDQVKGRAPAEALLAFCALADFARWSDEKKSAEELIREHPLQSLFTTVHFSRDGRVIYRSGGQGGARIFGEDSSVWKQMIQGFELRMSFLSRGALWPAFVQLTNEHHLGVSDFAEIVRGTGIVPADRVIQFAKALSYGFDGDFSTATQLLIPQLENLVRHHLANAGEPTSTITADHTEVEVGLSALMERPAVCDVFGDDIAFELRALLCGPIGPNLRNEVAHGLLSDTEASGGSSLYCWWFALRLVFIPYWNASHDTHAADAREPARPAEGSGES